MQSQFKITPDVGEILLYIALSRLQNMSIEEALKLLLAKGYQPSLEYAVWSDGNVGLYALLKQEKYDSRVQGESYLHDEFHHLCSLFHPVTAVRLLASDVKQPAAA